MTSNVYISDVKLWSFPTYQWFLRVSLRFLDWDDNKLRVNHDSTDSAETTSRLGGKTLKFDTWNIDDWGHLGLRLGGKLQSLTPEKRLTSGENMFLARAFTDRCNRRYFQHYFGFFLLFLFIEYFWDFYRLTAVAVFNIMHLLKFFRVSTGCLRRARFPQGPIHLSCTQFFAYWKQYTEQ